MKKLKHLGLCLLLVITVGSVVTGCRTAHGFGEDLEHAGESIRDHTE